MPVNLSERMELRAIYSTVRIMDVNLGLTIYAPMIYTAPCVMFLMRADTYVGKWWGVGAGNLVFCGPL